MTVAGGLVVGVFGTIGAVLLGLSTDDFGELLVEWIAMIFLFIGAFQLEAMVA
jgi:hypothetical protein